MILGIDAGHNKCGICLIDNGLVVYHKTQKITEALKTVENLRFVYRFKKAVVEMPSESVFYSKHFTTIRDPQKLEAIKRKIMCNVGENRQCAKMIIEKLQNIGIQTIERRPRKGTTKWDKEYWCKVFKYNKRAPSEHARDAGVLALQWENWIGWNILKGEV